MMDNPTIQFKDLADPEKKLLLKAKEVKENSYSPYSGFSVGSALMTVENKIFTGTNVENASYGLSICAEVGAIQSAVSAGHTKIKMLAVVGGHESQQIIPTPCGRCRQLIFEFSKPDPDPIRLILANDNLTSIFRTDILKLLPLPFGPVNLKNT